MRDSEYFDYNNYASEEVPESTDYKAEYEGEDTQKHKVHEEALNAASRFFESEPSEYTDGYERRRTSRTPKSEEPQPIQPEERWHSFANFNEDEEYMTRLANARRERQRRRETSPSPNPAVRVNVERPYTSTDYSDTSDWEPIVDEEFDTFRRRNPRDILAASGETPKEPRGRSKTPVPVYRHDSEAAPPKDGLGPLRFLLAVVLVGILGIMTFLVVNNRSLRRDLDEYQTRLATTDDNAHEVARLTVEVNSYREQIAELEEALENIEYLNHDASDNEYDYADANGEQDETTGAARPSVEDDADVQEPTPPPAPEVVTHIVQQGDTLSRIANQHFGSNAQRYVDLIANANNITNHNNIRLDEKIRRPPRE